MITTIFRYIGGTCNVHAELLSVPAMEMGKFVSRRTVVAQVNLNRHHRIINSGRISKCSLWNAINVKVCHIRLVCGVTANWRSNYFILSAATKAMRSIPPFLCTTLYGRNVTPAASTFSLHRAHTHVHFRAGKFHWLATDAEWRRRVVFFPFSRFSMFARCRFIFLFLFAWSIENVALLSQRVSCHGDCLSSSNNAFRFIEMGKSETNSTLGQ